MDDYFPDIRISNELYNKIKILEFSSLFFAFFGVGLSMLLYEMQNISDVSILRNLVLIYNIFCTIGLVLSIYFRYDITL